MEKQPWSIIQEGQTPLVGVALHSGHEVQNWVKGLMAIDPTTRMTEEDPFTDRLIEFMPNRVLAHLSRFQVDLNRPMKQAIYLDPSLSWDLQVWKQPLDQQVVNQLKCIHTRFYIAVNDLLEQLRSQFGRFLLVTIHSYERDRGKIKDRADIDVGTWTVDPIFQPVIDAFKQVASDQKVGGQDLVVRQSSLINEPTYFEYWLSQHFPESCYLSVEIAKEVFMVSGGLAVYTQQFKQLKELIKLATESSLQVFCTL